MACGLLWLALAALAALVAVVEGGARDGSTADANAAVSGQVESARKVVTVCGVINYLMIHASRVIIQVGIISVRLLSREMRLVRRLQSYSMSGEILSGVMLWQPRADRESDSMTSLLALSFHALPAFQHPQTVRNNTEYLSLAMNSTST